jgi:D-xylose transport system permease protein
LSDAAVTAPAEASSPPPANPLARGLDLLRQTEIDLRLFGMVLALIAIIVGFGIVGGDRGFLRPVNMITLSIQAAAVAIIATGMVLVIVTRNIDLSVGSIVGVVAMTNAVLMHEIFPTTPLGVENPISWLLAFLIGVGVGGLIGAFHGFIIAYVGVPSFIVTLGGLLAWRGVVWVIADGATVAPDDRMFVLLFAGNPEGSIGGLASWIVGLLIVAGLVFVLINGRRQRRRFGFPLRPMWAEVALGVAGAAAVLGFVLIVNSYKWPQGIVDRYVAEHPGFVPPPGGIEAGIPGPILIMIAVTLVVTFMAKRLRFGRAVYALGGNPDAAELAGINTRWTVMKTFILIGVLCGISGAIVSARLNGATIDIGQGYELLTIAAAVIGGTSFAGGIGTVPGAILGALVMQSLQYGLNFVGVSLPIQNIVAGIVLVVAVGLDSWNRRRSR